ncbi:monofunctional biosynthetic peptidoglycan transglycosylase [Mariprofundus micogutta]|uniref:Biosynthetic peptidoglycan transglycosylase n=1 Tax=Mariprofundus micogutta TaxID=1921010 RepID=A0A1L8CJX8_9PROT|nr:monofunctional biosynthetic peptidoglycan transglycosylase [Mariprofundus micogutta]GAV19185.1 monofunctional biosynthetic peptidoglycan transglycosylase [Mariprofundus micogutta]
MTDTQKKTISGWIKHSLWLLLLVTFSWHAYLYTQVSKWRTENPDNTAFMKATLVDMKEKNTRAGIRQTWIAYNRISPHLKRAVIAAEDARFTQHSGFDWDGIRVAMEKNISKGRIASGGSTISQQLAKNLFLSSEKSFLRKGEEAIITMMIEMSMSKKRILELYLNYAEWGNGIFGAEAAARHYYGIPASMLTRWQSATLASMLPNPRYYDGNYTRWLDEKSDMVLSRMPRVKVP